MKRIQSILLSKALIMMAAILLLPGFQIFAQNTNPAAKAVIDTTRIMVGDQVGMKLEFSFPKGARIDWPLQGDTIMKGIEIVKRSKIDTLPASGSLTVLSQRLTITSFDSGVYAIPPVRFAFMTQADTAPGFVETSPILFRVNTVAVDTTQAFKDIRGPIHAKYTFREALPWILLLFILIVVGVVVYYFITIRKGKVPFFQPDFKPKVPPHEAALQAIEALRQKKLWQNGQVKAYYTELIDIVRVYIEVTMGIAAAEMTSDEILEALGRQRIEPEAFGGLKSTLFNSDMVKFAKGEPLPTENDNAMASCIAFIMTTRQIAIQQPEKPDETAIETGKPELNS